MTELIIEKINHKRKLKVPSVTKLVLVGLTPGRVQHEVMNNSSRPREGAFKGSMRTRLFDWFNQLGINRELGVTHKDDLFVSSKYDELVFMTSLLRDPVYYQNGKNYSGRNPYPWDDKRLSKMMTETIKVLKTAPKTTIIIPCGEVVSQSLEEGLQGNHLIKNVLLGFPHPSGLNAHGPKKFQDRKRKFIKQVKKVWA